MEPPTDQGCVMRWRDWLRERILKLRLKDAEREIGELRDRVAMMQAENEALRNFATYLAKGGGPWR